ncbi:hypothetical protein A2U01_0013508 [Trifolium medium]|uniref:Uncharacterized protein n=1 Tax=Trifolium medium TaxID=97028 RepID=A0A392N0S6_9FABA|nr:hypothetical protein [Trifolium medium]
MVETIISGKISFGKPPIYSSSLKPNIGLPPFLVDGTFVLTEHMSAILLLLVPLDMPLGDESPPVIDPIFRALYNSLLGLLSSPSDDSLRDNFVNPPKMEATKDRFPLSSSSSLLSSSLSLIASTFFFGEESHLGECFRFFLKFFCWNPTSFCRGLCGRRP